MIIPRQTKTTKCASNWIYNLAFSLRGRGGGFSSLLSFFFFFSVTKFLFPFILRRKVSNIIFSFSTHNLRLLQKGRKKKVSFTLKNIHRFFVIFFVNFHHDDGNLHYAGKRSTRKKKYLIYVCRFLSPCLGVTIIMCYRLRNFICTLSSPPPPLLSHRKTLLLWLTMIH